MFFSNFFEPKPFNQGHLPEIDGHSVFFMELGNPQGEPILMFHAGPGSRCKAYHAKNFNLKKYRVIMFDQRGCGKSTPLGDIKNNNTNTLLDDAKRLLEHLKVNSKVIVRGASWGTTLALLFAQKHPKLVSKLLLTQLFLADSAVKNWECEISGLFYPEFLEKIKCGAGGCCSIPEYYADLINSDDIESQKTALNLYGNYERLLGTLAPKFNQNIIDEKNIASARVFMNYTARDFMINDNEILNNADKIAHIPTLIVHNRLDFVCPVQGAYRLHKALPMSKLVIVPEIGHVGKLLYKTIKKEIKEFLKND